MIAMSDSGPLIYLAAVNQFEVLRLYFSRLLIPAPVYQEVVEAGGTQPGSAETEAGVRAGWMVVEELQDISRIAPLLEEDMTWADACAHASTQEHRVDCLLSDDLEVRAQAAKRGLQVFGTLGILVEARRAGHFPNLRAVLDRLIQVGFYLNPEGSLYREVLRRAGEQG